MESYTIPVSTLRIGQNPLDFNVDWRFFREFEASPVEQGSFQIAVLFDKYPDHWHLHFEVTGKMDTECDRCLAAIALPIEGRFELFVKFDGGQEEARERSDEVVYVPRETTHFNIAQYIYEFIVLSIPVSKIYDCDSEQNPPCDKEMLARIEQQEAGNATEALSEVLKKMLK
jgi:uncharacterized metal-binding protein YceD (DUF177 family)